MCFSKSLIEFFLKLIKLPESFPDGGIYVGIYKSSTSSLSYLSSLSPPTSLVEVVVTPRPVPSPFPVLRPALLPVPIPTPKVGRLVVSVAGKGP